MADNFFSSYPSSGGGGVTSLNGLTGALTLVGGTGITVTPSGSNITIASTGLLSINADTTQAQLLSIGTAGTDFAITNPGGGSHVFNLPTASASNRGALSSADWSTFNAKQPAGAYMTALTGDVTAAGPGSSVASLVATSNSTLTTLSALSLPGAQVTGNISGNAANITASSNSTLMTLSALSLPGAQITGNISGNAANVTGIVAIAHGGTSVTSVTTTPTATSFAGWDTNSNLSANNHLPGYSTTSATGTIILTVSSPAVTNYTGAGATTVQLPVVSTLANGTTFWIINSLNANTLVVQTSGGNQITSGFGQGASGFITAVTVIDNTAGTGTSAWRWDYYISNPVVAPITSIMGPMTNNVTVSPTGSFSIGVLLNTLSNTFTLQDNFGDTYSTISQGPNLGTIFSTNSLGGGTFFGPLTFKTADNGSGPSGDLTLKTGTATTTRGAIRMNALFAALPVQTADPSGTFTGGEIYYNSTTTTVRFYNGTTWGDL